MGPQCQLLGHKCKLTLAAAIWLTGAMLDFAIVMKEHAVHWQPYKTYLLVSECCFFLISWPCGQGWGCHRIRICVLWAPIWRSLQCVLIPTSAVIWIWPLSMSEIFRVSRYIGGPRWWYTCIRPVNTWAYLTWQFCGRVDLTCKFPEAGSQSLDLFSKCVRIIV